MDFGNFGVEVGGGGVLDQISAQNLPCHFLETSASQMVSHILRMWRLMTHACENITFPHLLLRAVIITLPISRSGESTISRRWGEAKINWEKRQSCICQVFGKKSTP